MTRARITCAGLGPGDPMLMSRAAEAALRGATHIAYFRKAGTQGQARKIAASVLPEGVHELPMEYPVTTEIPVDHPEYNRRLAAFYDGWADRLAGLEQVVVLCEGDPFLYGSFMHLFTRLQGRAEMTVIPGITGMSGCWTATGQPMTWGDDVLSVLMGTLPEADLARHIAAADAVAIMKVGRNLPKIRRALDAAGRSDAAWVVSHGTMAEQRITRLSDLQGDVPYFAIVLLHGQGRRP